MMFTTFDFSIEYAGNTYQAHVSPSLAKRKDGTAETYQVLLNKYYLGDIYCSDTQWKIHSPKDVDQALVDLLGDRIWREIQ